jgi:hypothetical protein
MAEHKWGVWAVRIAGENVQISPADPTCGRIEESFAWSQRRWCGDGADLEELRGDRR